MQQTMKGVALGLVVAIGLSGNPAYAVNRLILGKKLLISNRTGTEDRRSISGSGSESSTDVPSVSNPATAGAVLTVIANGSTPSRQSYVLSASGWAPYRGIGFKYRGPTNGDPVKQVLLKRTPSGTASLTVTIKGSLGTQSVDVVPPNPGTDGGYILDVLGGDRYCVAFGGAAGGAATTNTAQLLKIIRPSAQPGCPVVPPPPGPSPLCPADPSRTIFAGGPSTAGCSQFDGDQVSCEKTFDVPADCGPASCFYASGSCSPCDANNAQSGSCVNTCVEGPPTCPGDPVRTILAGFSGSAACTYLSFSQTLCEKAFHVGGNGIVASCFFDTDNQECRGCGPNNQSQGLCQNTCPACAGDPSHNFYAGGPGSQGCHRFDAADSSMAAFIAAEDSCNAAFVIGDSGVETACYFDANSGSCKGCGPNNQGNGQCVNLCPLCINDPARHVYLGGPGSGACSAFSGNRVLCEESFHLSGACGVLASCYYDLDSDQCLGCGPNNQNNGACSNTCAIPICGDNHLNQPGEQCDGIDDGACVGSEVCGLDCRCGASPSGAFLDASAGDLF